MRVWILLLGVMLQFAGLYLLERPYVPSDPIRAFGLTLFSIAACLYCQYFRETDI